MKLTPITFSADMVRAILAGRKTQTRRPIKGSKLFPSRNYTHVVPHPQGGWMATDGTLEGLVPIGSNGFYCPYGQPGDRLILLCTWSVPKKYDKVKPSKLPHDVELWHQFLGTEKPEGFGKNRPARFMPNFLRVRMPKADLLAVSVQRVNEISEEDAVSEGIIPEQEYEDRVGEDNLFPCPQCQGYRIHPSLGNNLGVTESDCVVCDSPKKRFGIIWNSLYSNWDENPWVWAITFKVLKREVR